MFEDKNNDGVKDPGEPGIPGATVTLTGTDTAGNPVSQTVTTDQNGNYVFTGVPAGTYQVVESQPNGYLDGKDSGGNSGGTVTNDRVANISLPPGVTTPVTGVNFGEQLATTAKLSGFVYVDAGDDGVKGAGETPIAGVTVTLTGLDNNGLSVTRTATTDGNGFYEFANLRPGTYTVNESQPAAFNDGKDTAGTPGDGVAGNDVISNITLTSGENSQNNNFGELPKTNTISGVVFEDKDNDGIQDAGEPGIPGATVTLTGTDTAGNPVNRVVTTGQDGSYSFTGVPAGTYQVIESQPNGYLDGKDSGGNSGGTVTNDRVANIVLPAGVSTPVTGVNFGEQLAAKISGFVYVDAGDDGVKGAGEVGIGGVTVKLTGFDNLGAPVTATATTNAQGFYEFLGLRPGTYTVTETQPGGFNDGKDTAGTPGDGVAGNDVISNITLTSGENSQNNNFGELPVAQKSRLGDFVWHDVNGNGQQDTGEAGIAGVTVQLLNSANAVIQTTTTDNLGKYGFTVDAGTYSVNVVGPAGFTATTRDQGADATDSDISAAGRTGPYTVAGGGENLTIDAGYYKAASIGNQIWYDKNANGILDTGENGVAGVVVELRTNGVNGVDTGTVISTTTTDVNGKYLFSNLKPGDYHIDVQENTLPAGFVFTKSNQGANDAVDSDVRSSPTQPLSWGIMDNTNLVSGENDLTWDAGVYKVGIDVEKYVSSTQTTTSNHGGSEGSNCADWLSKCTTSSSWQWVSNGWWGGSWQEVKTPTGWSGVSGCTGKESFNQIFGCNMAGGTKSIYDVLCSTGTTSADKFMRECVAAYLNACHDKVDYAYNKDQVCAQTKWAVSTGKYDECRTAYEQENSRGCDWGNSKTNWNCVVDTQLYDADAPPGLEVKTGSTVTFTYIVKNTGDTALKNVVLVDDRIQTVTYVSGDTDKDGLLDTNESWTYTAKEVASAGTIKNTGTVTAVDAVGGVATVTDKDDAYYTGNGAAKSSIGDKVWEDTNFNGVQDKGEAGLAGVKVVLTGAGKDGVFGTKDDITATTTTTGSGMYDFNNLDAGKYVLTFQAAAGYLFTKANQGSNDAADSDVDSAGKTAEIVLDANEHDVTVDAGLYRKAKVGDKVFAGRQPQQHPGQR